MKVAWFVNVLCAPNDPDDEGLESAIFCFHDEAEVMNYIMDIQDHVYGIALSYEDNWIFN